MRPNGTQCYYKVQCTSDIMATLGQSHEMYVRTFVEIALDLGGIDEDRKLLSRLTQQKLFTEGYSSHLTLRVQLLL